MVDPWTIAVTVTLATFMDLLDAAIANFSLPHIAGALAVSYDESTWVLTSYLVSNAVILPLSVWLSRVFGPAGPELGRQTTVPRPFSRGFPEREEPHGFVTSPNSRLISAVKESQ